MPQPRQRRFAWAASVGGHLAVLALVALVSGEVQVGRRGTSNVGFDTNVVADLNDGRALGVNTEQTVFIQPEVSISDQTAEPELAPESPVVGDLVRNQLDRAQQAAASQTIDKKLSDLEAAAAKLAVISNAKSVEEISQSVNKVLDVSQVPEVDPNALKKFDINSAQIVDVREDSKQGKTKYYALMEDRRGLRDEVEVDADTGQQLAKTFALIKKFPLLESLYRKTVIGLLNKMLAEEANQSRKQKEPASRSGNPVQKPAE